MKRVWIPLILAISLALPVLAGKAYARKPASEEDKKSEMHAPPVMPPPSVPIGPIFRQSDWGPAHQNAVEESPNDGSKS